ncbi:Fructose-bisphosphate aldolase 2, cytoplasmic, partial [Cucurbita argyrosperma subsp. argyrosperma]
MSSFKSKYQVFVLNRNLERMDLYRLVRVHASSRGGSPRVLRTLFGVLLGALILADVLGGVVWRLIQDQHRLSILQSANAETYARKAASSGGTSYCEIERSKHWILAILGQWHLTMVHRGLRDARKVHHRCSVICETQDLAGVSRLFGLRVFRSLFYCRGDKRVTQDGTRLVYAAYRGAPENGRCSIVWSPEILVDGSHSIDKCAEVTERVLAACYKALNDHHVLLEGTLLKPNMVTPGSEAAKVAPEVIAEYTVRALQRTVPAAVPAIVFLSGGQSEEEATLNLNAMNKLKGKKPWSLSFSFGRALQQSTLKAWAGKDDNVEKARAAFLTRCKANSEATLGTYKGDAVIGEGAAESLHEKDYKY